MAFWGWPYMRVFAKFLILGQFFKGRLVRKTGLYVSIYSSFLEAGASQVIGGKYGLLLPTRGMYFPRWV